MPNKIATAEARIKAAVYRPIATLEVTAWVTGEPVAFAAREQGRKLLLRPGDSWSKEPFDCAWFHFTGAVPAEAAGLDIVLLIDINGEACVVDEAGHALLGLTNVSSTFSRPLGEPGKRVVPLFPHARGGENIDLWADAGANDLLGERQENGTLREALIAVRNPRLLALSYDFEVLRELMGLLPKRAARARRIRTALTEAAAAMVNGTESEAAAARALLAPALAETDAKPTLTVSAIGHAHMDLAWLWPIRETIRKCARTFATVLHMMERYPEYIFGASQAQQYGWVKQHYPDLYARIKARVAEGRWEIQGAMWVEADINLSGGEALIRQIYYGKRFFREEFGKDPACLWEPDVFGLSGALPQLLAKSGVTRFMTQKLSWNWVTRHPHHTFWWQGIDGSKVLAHFPPEDTYNSSAAPRALFAAARNFIDRAVSDRVLLLFGIGDGGGGPGEEHLERLAREKNLLGLPPLRQEPSDAFFNAIAQGGARYATWTGELYLERHQGTLTTQGRTKRANRKLELALRDLELAAAMAHLATGAPYPQAALESIWQETLLYQFHDILPGSSIKRVYDESLPRYDAMSEEVARLTATADTALVGALGANGAAAPVVVANSLSWPRTEWIFAKGCWVAASVPAMGYAVIDAATPQRFIPPVAADAVLENDQIRLEFSADGSIRSCFDKERACEVLAPGGGNRLALYDDPGDAWDIAMQYRDQAAEMLRVESVERILDGPRAVRRQTYRFGKSRLTQDIVLFTGSRRIDFVTDIDWQESARMLRTGFAVAVETRDAVCDIQFGSIRRPTHDDTPADRAKFEVCAHKWADLSDGVRGVALLNDCKYGHRLKGNVLDLNLLRSPHYPDPSADRGPNRFTYALYPHAGDFVAGQVVRRGYELNVPLRICDVAPGNGALPAAASWLSVDAGEIVIETVKRAEDGRGIIVRLYESAGAARKTVLRCGFPLAAAFAVTLIEEDIGAVPWQGAEVPLNFGRFEILSLRLLHSGAR
jgi:alpha-mannosidase